MDNNRPFGGQIWNRNAYYSLLDGRRHFVKRRVFSAPEKEGSIERGFKDQFRFRRAIAQDEPSKRSVWVLGIGLNRSCCRLGSRRGVSNARVWAEQPQRHID